VTEWIQAVLVCLLLTFVMCACGDANDRRWDCTMRGERCDQPYTVSGENNEGQDNQGESDPSTAGIPGADGQDGPQGDEGVAGPAGPQGEEGSQGEMGLPGQVGPQGPAGTSSIVALIDPCGDNPTKTDEVLLVLDTGEVLSANTKGLTYQLPGVYTTDDGTACTYTIHPGGSITW